MSAAGFLLSSSRNFVWNSSKLVTCTLALTRERWYSFRLVRK